MTNNKPVDFHCVPCDGSAHENAHIDHCMICLGFRWGRVAVPVTCKTMDDWREMFASASEEERKALTKARKAWIKKQPK